MNNVEKIAYLIGKLMGDGHLEKTLGSCYFISGNKNDLLSLRKFILDGFDVKKANTFLIKQNYNNGSSYKLRINNTKFCKLLFNHGAPKGNKIKTVFYLLEWILKDKRYSKSFLQGLLEDELANIKIIKANHCREAVLRMYKIENLLDKHLIFMQQVKSCIESFSVTCSKIRAIEGKNLGTMDVYFSINGNKMNIIRFKDNIGFRFNSKKIDNLDVAYNILNKTLKSPINKDKIRLLKRNNLSLRKIASITNVSWSTVHRILKKQMGGL
jgi:hypothetical protein